MNKTPYSMPCKLGVAIPCYKPHLGKLIRLLDSLEAQVRKPDRVVVVTSSTTAMDLPFSFPSYSFKLSLLLDSDPRKAAENRNTCISLMTDCDCVSFIDADDVCHPQRCEIIENAFLEGAELIVHSFTHDMDAPWAPVAVGNIEYDVLARAPTGCLIHTRRPTAVITHGHVSVARRILSFQQFGTTPYYDRREDALFCGDAVISCKRTAYIGVALSKYDRSSSSEGVSSVH
jgi:glycosyltransferase involved in cell wall biosynthesis